MGHMRHYCLSKQELDCFFDHWINGIRADSEHFAALLEDWDAFELEFVCISILLARSFETIQKQERNPFDVLKRAYNHQSMYPNLTIKELDTDFVHYLLTHHERDENLTLEEQLIFVQSNRSDYIFP